MEGIGKRANQLPNLKNANEQVDENFEREIGTIIERGHEEMASSYDGLPYMRYHNSPHPRGMDTVFTNDLAPALGIGRRSLLIGRAAIAKHDKVMSIYDEKWTPFDPEHPQTLTAQIERKRGAIPGDEPAGAEGNEGLSADDLEASMRKANIDAGKDIFTEEDIALGRLCIYGTYPVIGMKSFAETRKEFYANAMHNNPELGDAVEWLEKREIHDGLVVFQKHLETRLNASVEYFSRNRGVIPQSIRVPLAMVGVAISDLQASVMAADPKRYFDDGDNEFMELKRNLHDERAKEFLKVEGGDPVNPDSPAAIRGTLSKQRLGWLRAQPGLAAWRGVAVAEIREQLRTLGDINARQSVQLHHICGRATNNVEKSYDRWFEANQRYQSDLKEKGEREAALVLLSGMNGYQL